MDHLKGKLTIDHETARTLTFPDAKAFLTHMERVYHEDGKRYAISDSATLPVLSKAISLGRIPWFLLFKGGFNFCRCGIHVDFEQG